MIVITAGARFESIYYFVSLRVTKHNAEERAPPKEKWEQEGRTAAAEVLHVTDGARCTPPSTKLNRKVSQRASPVFPNGIATHSAPEAYQNNFFNLS